ncbi:HINT domain-containing protein [Streptomyces sp. NBC_01335]|uniref:polymorphic toxin-type HINT domain-containing protein n=1 Tax=Streptomyces sp. NBC_01335 TaxID=2903828 RepID=UPI002E1470BE|nr:HINT domain-containing protein [Streptomyces sp. NBC_01335]
METGGASLALATQCGAIAGAAGGAVGNWMTPDADHSVAGVFGDMTTGAVLGAAGGAGGEALAAAAPKIAKVIFGCHSFLPGTGVLLADGTHKAIEDVEVGDEVVTTDVETGKTTERPVADTITTVGDKDFTEVSIRDGGEYSSIIATDTHPFWVTELHKWVVAGDIQVGQWLHTSAGSRVQVTGVRHYTKPQLTHDLTVTDIHAYYVLAGDTPLLVHNCDITMEEAINRAVSHVGDNATVVRSGSGAVQFMNVMVDGSGNAVRKIARFDVNPNSAHVQKLGPHLNLETQINGKTVTKGPLKDPHTGIIPSTIRPGDYWS